MTKRNFTISNLKNIEKFNNVTTFCRTCLFLLLFSISLNLVKAQSQDITTEKISFESEGVSLVGMIYQPLKPIAAVVIVHGSGQEGQSKDFATLLVKNGILSLTYDKRGVGESGGIYAGPEVGTNNIDPDNLDLLAEDTKAAINVLYQQNKDIPIGLIGFSQAGWIIPIAANKSPHVDFMVLFSGSLVPTLEQLRFQFFTDGREDFWDNHTEVEVRERILNDKDRYQFATTDPCDFLSRLSIPGLWLFGGKDIQIPVGLSIEKLNALKVEGKPYEYCLFSTLGHNLTFSDTIEPVLIAIQWIRNHYAK